MTIKKGFVSYSEKYERITITRKAANKRFKAVCKSCGKAVDWLTVSEVSAITGTSHERFSERLANSEVHFVISDRNEFLVCAVSATENI